jgi:hypothetical protein
MEVETARYSRREFLRLASVTAAGAALAACGLNLDKPTPRSSGPVQLVYSDWRTPWFPPLVQSMLAEFNASHPNIRVFYTPDPDNLAVKMASDMAPGTAPDVFDGCCDFFQAWAKAGHPLVIQRTTRGVVELHATGFPLGIFPRTSYDEEETVMDYGDSLLMYSDGLIEAHNPRGEMFDILLS